jgi:hypothetical protein
LLDVRTIRLAVKDEVSAVLHKHRTRILGSTRENPDGKCVHRQRRLGLVLGAINVIE